MNTLSDEQDQHWMQYALQLAIRARDAGEVPVGAVLVQGNQIIGEGWNQPISTSDPTAHAEIIALRDAARVLQNYRLGNTTLYATLEPCPMCAGAILHARVQRVVFGARDAKGGAVGSVVNLFEGNRWNHSVCWQADVLAMESVALLQGFFVERRKKN